MQRPSCVDTLTAPVRQCTVHLSMATLPHGRGLMKTFEPTSATPFICGKLVRSSCYITKYTILLKFFFYYVMKTGTKPISQYWLHWNYSVLEPDNELKHMTTTDDSTSPKSPKSTGVSHRVNMVTDNSSFRFQPRKVT